MTLDSIRNLDLPAPSRDEIDELKQQGFKRYVSPWVRIDAAGTYSYPHGLGDIPHVISVLGATDAQGTAQTEATSVTVTSTVSMVVVANTGAARFFKVRAF